MADYSKLANDLLRVAGDFDLANGPVVSSVPAHTPDLLRDAANAVLDLQRERDELIKALEVYRHCRHACIICFCTDAAVVALAKLKGGGDPIA